MYGWITDLEMGVISKSNIVVISLVNDFDLVSFMKLIGPSAISSQQSAKASSFKAVLYDLVDARSGRAGISAGKVEVEDVGEERSIGQYSGLKVSADGCLPIWKIKFRVTRTAGGWGLL